MVDAFCRRETRVVAEEILAVDVRRLWSPKMALARHYRALWSERVVHCTQNSTAGVQIIYYVCTGLATHVHVAG